MRIQRINTGSNNYKNTCISVTSMPSIRKQECDEVTFTAKNNFASQKKLKAFIHELAQNYISKDYELSEIKINEFGESYADKSNGKVFKYISRLEDKVKADAIRKSIAFVDEFKQFYMHTLFFDDSCIVRNHEEAKDMVDIIKTDFAESTSLISDQKLKYKLVNEFLKSPDQNIQYGARNSISSIDDVKLKDKLINTIAKRENAFDMSGDAFNNFDFLLKNASDNLQVKLIKKYITAQGLDSNACYHIISDEQRIKNPQKTIELIKFLTPINNFRYQSEIMPLLENLPIAKREEAFVQVIKAKSKNNDETALCFLDSPATLSEMKKLSYDAKKKILPFLEKNEDFSRLNKDFLSSFLQDDKALPA